MQPLVNPLVSVVMPMRNAERYVADAVMSVLTQSHRTIEALVVDDGSTDKSVEVAKQIADDRVRVLRQRGSGAAAARNFGVAESSGTLLAFLDADDLWTPRKLALQIGALDADPGLDMVFGHAVDVDGTGGPIEREPTPAYSTCTMLIRRERFLQVGPFSTAWRLGEFIDWYARADDFGLRHVVLPEVLMQRRVHGDNLTGERQNRADYARVVRAAAARRGLLRHAGS